MSYVCYKVDTGEILSIINGSIDSYTSELDWAYLEVPFKEVEKILTGIETPKSYVVEYDRITNTHSLKERSEFDAEELDITNLIYHIPIVKDDNDEDIQVVQDIKNTCWKIFISQSCEKKLRQDFANLNFILHFAITEENNPHHLFRMLSVSLEKLVKNHCQVLDFKYDYEATDMPLSIYTMKRFNSYCYKRNYE